MIDLKEFSRYQALLEKMTQHARWSISLYMDDLLVFRKQIAKLNLTSTLNNLDIHQRIWTRSSCCRSRVVSALRLVVIFQEWPGMPLYSSKRLVHPLDEVLF